MEYVVKQIFFSNGVKFSTAGFSGKLVPFGFTLFQIRITNPVITINTSYLSNTNFNNVLFTFVIIGNIALPDWRFVPQLITASTNVLWTTSSTLMKLFYYRRMFANISFVLLVIPSATFTLPLPCWYALSISLHPALVCFFLNYYYYWIEALCFSSLSAWLTSWILVIIFLFSVVSAFIFVNLLRIE